MPIHHVTYAMPNARNAQRKAIHMLQRSSHTKLANHRLLEGRQKRARHHRQKAKEHKTHKLPLNSCIKAKEHTKLTLHTWDREKSKRPQVAWPRPHTWRSQKHLPLSFLQKSLILIHHPRKWCTSMSPPVGVLDRQPTKGSTRSRWMWLAEIGNSKEETRGTQFRQVRAARCVIPYVLYAA
jgi:hypothetical protein